MNLLSSIHKKHLIVVGVLLVIVLAGIGIAQQWYRSANPIVVSKVPQDIKIFVDDKEVSGSRTHLPNGTYTVRAEKEGFAPYSEQVVIDDFSTYIAVALTPESTEAKEWAERNQSLYLEQESFVGTEEQRSGQEFLNLNPIVKELPLDNYTYSIGYIIDKNDPSGKSIILTVDTITGYRNAATEAIYKLGYDPANFTITFKDYTNPFAGETDEN